MFDDEEDTSTGFVDGGGSIDREEYYNNLVEPYIDKIWGGFVHDDNRPYGDLFGAIALGVNDEEFAGPTNLLSLVPTDGGSTSYHHELNADAIAELLKRLGNFKVVIDAGVYLTGSPESLRTVIDNTIWNRPFEVPGYDGDPRAGTELPSVMFHSTDPRRPMPAGIDIEEAKKRFCDMSIWYEPVGDHIEVVMYTSRDTEGIEEYLNNNYLPDEAWELEGETPPSGNVNENLQNIITFDDEEDTSTGFVGVNGSADKEIIDGIRFFCYVSQYKSDKLREKNPFRCKQKDYHGQYWSPKVYDPVYGGYPSLETVEQRMKEDAGYEDDFNDNMDEFHGEWSLEAHDPKFHPDYEGDGIECELKLGYDSHDVYGSFKRLYEDVYSNPLEIQKLVEEKKSEWPIGDFSVDAMGEQAKERLEEDDIFEPDYKAPGYEEYLDKLEDMKEKLWQEQIGQFVEFFFWNISDYMKEIIDSIENGTAQNFHV